MTSLTKHNLSVTAALSAAIISMIILAVSDASLFNPNQDQSYFPSLTISPRTQVAALEGAGSGLVGWWKFDEGSGSTVADSSRSGNAGTLTNGPGWTAGKVGGALTFDGVNDKVTVNHHDSLNPSEISISFWANIPSNPGTSNNTVIEKGYYDNQNRIRVLNVTNNFQWVTTGGNSLALTNESITYGHWEHWVFTGDGSGLKAYKNGSLISSKSTAYVAGNNTNPLGIGGSGFYLNAILDDVRIYSRALPSSEISELYSQSSSGSNPPPEPSPTSDTQAPSIPSNLAASTVSSNQLNLTWSASTDDTGVAGYRVYRNGSQITTTSDTSYADTSLSPNTSYAYAVSAYDAAGNVSDQPSQVSATTQSQAVTAFNLSVPPPAASGDIYVSQAGSGSGSSCSDSRSVAWLNNPSNWATSGTGRVVPGTVIHLCGTISDPLIVQGSGTQSSPIVVYFERDAKMSAPVFQASPGNHTGGAILINGKRYITIDGGINGIIENTDCGSKGSFSNWHTNDADNNINGTIGVHVYLSQNIEVKNLSILNIYQSQSTFPNPDFPGRYGDVGTKTSSSGIYVMRGDDISIHDNTIDYVGLGISIGMMNNSDVEINNNLISRTSAAIFTGGYTSSERSVIVHHNTISDTTNWAYNDGIKFFGTVTTRDVFNGISVYNNKIGPKMSHPGHPSTAWILITTGWFSRPRVYNNLLIGDSLDDPANAFITVGGANSAYGLGILNMDSEIFGNTIISELVGSATAGIQLNYSSIGHLIYNNLFKTSGSSFTAISVLAGSSIGDSDYNLYYANPGSVLYWGDDNRDFTNDGTFNPPRHYTPSYGEWNNTTSFDDHSVYGVNPLLSQNYQLDSQSSAINAGLNLASYCAGASSLCFDFAGTLRSQGASWDIGAYEYVSGGTPSTPTCTSFTYSSWGTCTAGTQTRTVLSSSPSGCTGGSPITSQSCTPALNADTTSPTITITAPSQNSTLSGNVTLTASAFDPSVTGQTTSGISTVQFKLDGINLGSPLTISPYTGTWNTIGVSHGTHTLTAVATDGAGNTTTSTGITVNVQNTAPVVTAPTPPAGGETPVVNSPNNPAVPNVPNTPSTGSTGSPQASLGTGPSTSLGTGTFTPLMPQKPLSTVTVKTTQTKPASNPYLPKTATNSVATKTTSTTVPEIIPTPTPEVPINIEVKTLSWYEWLLALIKAIFMTIWRGITDVAHL